MFGGGKFDPWEAPAVSTWRQDIVSLPQTLMTSFMALAAAHIQIQTKSVSLVSFIIFPSIHTIIFITTLWNCNILIYEIQHFVWPIRQFSFGLSVKQIQMNFEVILFALIIFTLRKIGFISWMGICLDHDFLVALLVSNYNPKNCCTKNTLQCLLFPFWVIFAPI